MFIRRFPVITEHASPYFREELFSYFTLVEARSSKKLKRKKLTYHDVYIITNLISSQSHNNMATSKVLNATSQTQRPRKYKL